MLYGEFEMLIVGQVSSKEEAEEIAFIAKIFLVGNRIRTISKK